MAEGKKRLFTGLQPSGKLHIGNYFGALKPFVESYESFESMLMVADYHALTTSRDPKQLRENIIDVVRDYLAVGVDPEKVVMFKQSDVPEHTEMAWIFECLVTVSFLNQAHAHKDKAAKGLEVNAGLFNYPMLMAADILLYDSDIVPTGQDQRQHIEYAREAASKFNHAYGDTFIEPKEQISKEGALPGIDGKKMSKSYRNTIPLFGSDEEIRAAVMTIQTDSTPYGEPLAVDQDTLFTLHTYVTPDIDSLKKRYQEGSIGYKESKELLAENLIALIAPMRQKRDAVSIATIEGVLKRGAKIARERAGAKMAQVREKIGVSI